MRAAHPVNILIGIPVIQAPGMMLQKLLDSLASQVPDGARMEVFVVDNDPEEGAALALCEELAESFVLPLSAAVLAEPGIAAVRNRLLDEAERRGSDLLVMIDDDEYVSPRWLTALVAAHQSFGAAVVGGPVLYDFAEPASAALIDSAAPFHSKRRPSGRVAALVEASGNLLLDCAALKRRWLAAL